VLPPDRAVNGRLTLLVPGSWCGPPAARAECAYRERVTATGTLTAACGYHVSNVHRTRRGARNGHRNQTRRPARSATAIRITLRAPLVSKGARVGDSIAVNGCCLTVVAKSRTLLSFEAGSETLSRTNLGRLEAGSQVNVERSLKLGDRLGGHFVTGHIDGQGSLVRRREEGEWAHLRFRAEQRLLRQMVEKGSIAIDGVSLTVVAADDGTFSVALIPHTLANTTLGNLAVGTAVNLETDLLAKYVARQLESRR
jgi:riboflavin synthase